MCLTAKYLIFTTFTVSAVCLSVLYCANKRNEICFVFYFDKQAKMQRYYGSDDTSQDSISRTTRSANKIEKRLTVENSKFLADFDPEKSSRERRKLTRKSYVVAPSVPSRNQSLFDENGRYRNTNADLCDCLEDCPGCHCTHLTIKIANLLVLLMNDLTFVDPCPQCSSPKCGPVCRVNRRWAFEVSFPPSFMPMGVAHLGNDDFSLLVRAAINLVFALLL